ncbi:Cytochrome b5 reductase 4 [Melipona quadrifasciata]|uniref:Cytochrome b5 reductase 4 n=1 Tax=Melipona quadrifasciata TaxID=166423 RepID=A0A0M8ZRR0_9HYME|nr:Cytochrome b5 reductase 4 [Melipona quadrifasciata]
MPRCCGASLVSVVDGDGSPQSLGLQIQDGNPRNKTALAPGHSLMDWIRLGNSGADLTGVGGVPRIVTLSELASHNKKNDAWIAIRGIVFNVTQYMDFHPGGIDELMRGVGKDATKLFESVHAWVNYQSILQKCVVGRLSRGSVSGTTPSPTENTTVSNTADCSSATLNQITSCTTDCAGQENVPDGDLSSIKMDWKQTIQLITFFFKQQTCKSPGLCYELTKQTDSKLIFKLIFENDTTTHILDLIGKIKWPPTCIRNFETMQVDFTFLKQEKMPWINYGIQMIMRETSTARLFREYEVVANILLSNLVHLLVLRAKDFLQIITPGRHVIVKLNDIDMLLGKDLSRSYTPVPPCLHPDYMPPNYTSNCQCLIIKKYPNGAISPSITTLQVGQTLLLSGVVGTFAIEKYDRYSVIHMVAAGTGLTPMLGIIQRSLSKRSVKTINLLHFNKNEQNMFYEDQLEKVSGKKLKVTHILSQPRDTWTGIRGVVSYELLEELVGKCKPDECVFTCGPLPFMRATRM